MEKRFSRTELLIGKNAMEKLKNSRVAVFGIGGVGGYAVEALARSGVGSLDLIDGDKVSITNINRQIIATCRTIGQYKVDAAKERVFDICPDTAVQIHRYFYMPENKNQFDFSKYDYIIDAIDTVRAKLSLIDEAQKAGTPIISSMGAGNKLDASAFAVADIYDTKVCPLARVMRYELRRMGIQSLKVVCSKEEPIKSEDHGEKGAVPGSVAFVPAAAGLILAGEVIRDLIKEEFNN